MIDVIKIAVLERHSLIRGLLVSFFVSLPFCFLPTLIEHGFVPALILARTPIAALYAFLFSVIILFAALMQNYQSLKLRKILFDKPAFASLDFYGRVDGVGSIVRELETFLMGKITNFYFRLNLVDPDQSPFQIEIVPFIKPTHEQTQVLVNEHNFQQGRFFGLQIEVSEEDLDDENFLYSRLRELDDLLTVNEVAPLIVHESDL